MSSRRRAPKRAAVSASVRRGLESLAAGNEATIASMLDKDEGSDASAIADAMEEVMGVNSLSAEMLLARFFDAGLLSTYSSEVLGKSGKGSAATLAARIAGEWAKASFGAKKRAKVAEPEEEEEDWRTPLFYWRGPLVYDPRARSLSWKGSWVASAEGLPSDEDFRTSANAFELSTKPFGGTAMAKAEALSRGILENLRFDFTKGSYLLDQGQGLESFSDTSHRCLAKAIGDQVVLGACGSTEFGRFVSAGTVETAVGAEEEFFPAWTLTLARRYVDDADKRAKWTAPEKVCDALADASAPWNDTPWKLPRDS